MTREELLYDELSDFTMFLNSKLEHAYLGAKRINEVKSFYRTRTMIRVEYDDNTTGTWVFENVDTATEIQERLKRMLIEKDVFMLEKQKEAVSKK